MENSAQNSNTEEHEIRLGTGMGPLKFGASQDEVRALMGEPEEIEESEDDDEFERRAAVIQKSDKVRLSTIDRQTLDTGLTGLKSFTDYAPTWVFIIVSLSLGVGTMVGWQRIVKTIGERIGKEHLSYAQGASSELVAASMIGISSGLGLPASTTHVLTSSIAGSMVASRGVKNVNPTMVRNIALAWVLTLPVTMTLSGLLFLLFRTILPG